MTLLREIETRPPLVKPLGITLAVAVSSFGWAAMFGGGWMDCVVACFVALLSQAITFVLDNAGMRSFVSTLFGSFLSTILPMLFHLATGMLVVDATVAAVVLDANGKIVLCRIDVAQNKMDVTGGAVDTAKTFETKMELGSRYGMAGIIDNNGDGVMKEKRAGQRLRGLCGRQDCR